MELNLVIVTILESLLSSGGRCALSDLETRLNVTRRTLGYNLSKLNYVLEREGFPQVVPAEHQLTLDMARRADMFRWLAEQPPEDYVLSAGERKILITISVGLMGKHTTLDALCERMGVSRNTVLGDMAQLRQALAGSGLLLSNRSRQGYQINGDELTLRCHLYESLTRLETEFARARADQLFLDAARALGVAAQSRPALFAWLEGLIQQAETCLDGKLNHNSISEISYYILMTLCRAGQGGLFLDAGEIVGTLEYQMALGLERLLLPEGDGLPEQERLYLATVLLGAKRYSYREVARREGIDLRGFARELIDTFETKACVRFGNREQLIKQFIVHLRPLYYRLKYRIKVRNLLCGEIRKEYRGIYDLTSLAVGGIETRYGLKIPEEELAYLSVYLLTWLKRQRLSGENGDRQILIVCGAGVGTSLLLCQQISEILGMGYRYQTRDVRELEGMDLSRYDLVVTTAELPLRCAALLKTDPILSTRQKEQLLEWSCSKPGRDEVGRRVEQVLAAVEAHGAVQDRTGLLLDLRRMFERDNDAERGPGLWDALTPEMIRISARAMDGRQGLEYACARLVSKGLAEPGYAESVMDIIDHMGLYAEISPGVLLAHAKPDAGVHGVGLALTVFREGIAFPEWGKRITAVFALCTPDNQVHLRLLRELMRLLDSEAVRSALVDCPYQSPERLHRFLRRAGEGNAAL